MVSLQFWFNNILRSVEFVAKKGGFIVRAVSLKKFQVNSVHNFRLKISHSNLKETIINKLV